MLYRACRPMPVARYLKVTASLWEAPIGFRWFWWESGRYGMTLETRSSNFGADILKYWKCLSSSRLRIGSTRETNSPSWSRVVFKGRTYHRLSLRCLRCRRRFNRSNKMHSSSVSILTGMSPAKTPVTLLPPVAWAVYCMKCIARVTRVCCVDYERKRVACVTRVAYARCSRWLCKGPKCAWIGRPREPNCYFSYIV